MFDKVKEEYLEGQWSDAPVFPDGKQAYSTCALMHRYRNGRHSERLSMSPLPAQANEFAFMNAIRPASRVSARDYLASRGIGPDVPAGPR